MFDQASFQLTSLKLTSQMWLHRPHTGPVRALITGTIADADDSMRIWRVGQFYFKWMVLLRQLVVYIIVHIDSSSKTVISTPGISTPGISTPFISTPGISTPGSAISDISTPGSAISPPSLCSYDH